MRWEKGTTSQRAEGASEQGMQRPCNGRRLEQLRRDASFSSPTSERWGHKKRQKEAKGGKLHKTSIAMGEGLFNARIIKGLRLRTSISDKGGSGSNNLGDVRPVCKPSKEEGRDAFFCVKICLTAHLTCRKMQTGKKNLPYEGWAECFWLCKQSCAL